MYNMASGNLSPGSTQLVRPLWHDWHPHPLRPYLADGGWTVVMLFGGGGEAERSPKNLPSQIRVSAVVWESKQCN